MSAAYQQKKDGSCTIRYFGFDFEGSYPPKEITESSLDKLLKKAMRDFANIITIAFPSHDDFTKSNPWEDTKETYEPKASSPIPYSSIVEELKAQNKDHIKYALQQLLEKNSRN